MLRQRGKVNPQRVAHRADVFARGGTAAQVFSRLFGRLFCGGWLRQHQHHTLRLAGAGVGKRVVDKILRGHAAALRTITSL